MKKVVVDGQVRINAYRVIERAIDVGINYGYNRAHKHIDNPSPDSIKDEILKAVMNEICEILKFDDHE